MAENELTQLLHNIHITENMINDENHWELLEMLQSDIKNLPEYYQDIQNIIQQADEIIDTEDLVEELDEKYNILKDLKEELNDDMIDPLHTAITRLEMEENDQKNKDWFVAIDLLDNFMRDLMYQIDDTNRDILQNDHYLEYLDQLDEYNDFIENHTTQIPYNSNNPDNMDHIEETDDLREPKFEGAGPLRKKRKSTKKKKINKKKKTNKKMKVDKKRKSTKKRK